MKYALVFGNEVMGVGQQAVDMCHGAIEIPQAGDEAFDQRFGFGRCRFVGFFLPNPAEALTLPR